MELPVLDLQTRANTQCRAIFSPGTTLESFFGVTGVCIFTQAMHMRGETDEGQLQQLVHELWTIYGVFEGLLFWSSPFSRSIASGTFRSQKKNTDTMHG
jgi:hypothetical protein